MPICRDGQSRMPIQRPLSQHDLASKNCGTVRLDYGTPSRQSQCRSCEPSDPVVAHWTAIPAHSGFGGFRAVIVHELSRPLRSTRSDGSATKLRLPQITSRTAGRGSFPGHPVDPPGGRRAAPRSRDQSRSFPVHSCNPAFADAHRSHGGAGRRASPSWACEDDDHRRAK